MTSNDTNTKGTTMTNAEVQAALAANLKTMTSEALVDICCKLARDYTTHAGMVSDAALAELSRRLPSDKFVAFCDELYAAMA